MKKKSLLLPVLATAFCLSLIQHSQAQYANKALSNLTTPTAVNTDLVPAGRTQDIGSIAHPWRNFIGRGDIYYGRTDLIDGTFKTSGIIYFLGTPVIQFNGPTYPFNNITAIGVSAGANGVRSTAVGYYAMANGGGDINTAVGDHAMIGIAGNYNSAFGGYSLTSNSTGEGNTAIGTGTLYSNTTGISNTAVGVNTMYSNTTGIDNTAVGTAALRINDIGYRNTAVGLEALVHNGSGNYNTASGFQSLYSNTKGSYNIGIGTYALYNNTINAYNVAIGLQAGYHNTSRGTFLGTYADAKSDLTNVTALGYGATATASNQVRVGNSEVTSIGGQVSWTAFSDGRYKKNIKEDVPGLAFITSLRPVTYTLDVEGIDKAMGADEVKGRTFPAVSLLTPPYMKESGKQKNTAATPAAAFAASASALQSPGVSAEEQKAKEGKAKIKYTGFVAQEVEEAAKKVNYDFSGVDKPKNSNDFYGLRYSEFVVPLVKAVQEQQQQIEQLKTEVAELKALMNSTSLSLSSAYLETPVPNPSSGNTLIRYHVPTTVSNAKLVISDMKGSVIKTLNLGSRGMGQLNLSTGTLAAGSYTYTLYVDNVQTDSKQLVVSR